MKSRVAIIIVNWNSYENTQVCLSSLNKLKSTGSEVLTIVVDNGSTDDSVVQLKENLDVVILSLKKNLGFTGGNNEGIRFALEKKVDYIWLLNNDTIVDPTSLEALLLAAQSPKAGIVGSKIYFMKGFEFHNERYLSKDRGHVLWYAGGIIDWANMYASHRGVDEIDKGQYDRLEETQFITGCSMFIKKAVISDIGFLDERYFVYLEDVDFSLRAHKKYSLLFEPSSLVWHKNAGSTAKPGHSLQEYYLTRNRLLIGMTYAPTRTKIALIREAMRNLSSATPAKRKAIFDFIFNKYGDGFAWKPQ